MHFPDSSQPFQALPSSSAFHPFLPGHINDESFPNHDEDSLNSLFASAGAPFQAQHHGQVPYGPSERYLDRDDHVEGGLSGLDPVPQMELYQQRVGGSTANHPTDLGLELCETVPTNPPITTVPAASLGGYAIDQSTWNGASNLTIKPVERRRNEYTSLPSYPVVTDLDPISVGATAPTRGRASSIVRQTIKSDSNSTELDTSSSLSKSTSRTTDPTPAAPNDCIPNTAVADVGALEYKTSSPKAPDTPYPATEPNRADVAQALASKEEHPPKASIQEPSAATAAPTRRQHRSCDQCRKGKRACDAQIPQAEITLARKSGHVLTREKIQSMLPRDPCFNCAKTFKVCTFEWLTGQLLSMPSKKAVSDASGPQRRKREPQSTSDPLEWSLEASNSPKGANSHRRFSQVNNDTGVPALALTNASSDGSYSTNVPKQNEEVNFNSSQGFSTSPPQPSSGDCSGIRYGAFVSLPPQDDQAGRALDLSHERPRPFLKGSNIPLENNHVRNEAANETATPSGSLVSVCQIPTIPPPHANADSEFIQHQQNLNSNGTRFAHSTDANELNQAPSTYTRPMPATVDLSSKYWQTNHSEGVVAAADSSHASTTLPVDHAYQETILPVSVVPSNAAVPEGLSPMKPNLNSTAIILSPTVKQSKELKSSSADASDRERLRKRRHSRARLDESKPQFIFSLSDSVIAYATKRLFGTTNSNIIQANLLQIYNDSFENALSCWLSMRTCPFRSLTDWTAEEFEESEWGNSWPNRVVSRVFALDKSVAALTKRPMAQQDDKLVNKALQLTMLAFGAQWSQSSQKGKESYSEAHSGTQSHPKQKEFDQTLFEELWPRARQALADAISVESFRLVFAVVIFALTQPPISSRFPSGMDAMKDITKAAEKWSLDDMDQVFDFEEPPVILEQGLRSLYCLRARLDKLEREAGGPVLGKTDRQTLGLVSWLVVILDTISSAVLERPLVVSDADSAIAFNVNNPDGSVPLLTAIPMDQHGAGNGTTNGVQELAVSSMNDLWGEFFFVQNEMFRGAAAPLRWPCTYEESAALLCDAAPIKILFYRIVTKIQTHLSRKVYGRPLEAAILEIFRTYITWNHHFDPFMRDCISNHNSLSQRVQSWYICLNAHWHLGVTLFADILEKIDASGFGLEAHSSVRKAYSIAARLKRDSAYALSDLARCSCPQDWRNPKPGLDPSTSRQGPFATGQDFDVFAENLGKDGVGEEHSNPEGIPPGFDHYQSDGFSPIPLKDFHFAVQDGALLTEPWTAILVRSFAQSGMIMMRDYDKGVTEPPTDLPDRSLLESIDCLMDTMRRPDPTLTHEEVAKLSSGSMSAKGTNQFNVQVPVILPDGSTRFTSVVVDSEGRSIVSPRNSLVRIEECVRALWYLGKKSDISRLSSIVLRQALDERIRAYRSQNPSV